MGKSKNKTVLSTENTSCIRESSSAVVSKESANDAFTDFKSDVVNESMEETNNENSRMLLLNAMNQYECKMIREFNE